MEIYTVSENMLNELFESYSRYLTDPFSLERQSIMWKVAYFVGNSNVDLEPQPLKGRKDLIMAKPQINETFYHFKVLIHLLVNSSFENYDGAINLPSGTLYRLDKHYKLKLDILLMYGFIVKDIDYSGDYSQITYFINMFNEICVEETKNIKIIKPLSYIETELDNYQQIRLEELSRRTSKSFVVSYNKSLKEFNIDKSSALKFSTSNGNLKNRSKLYYLKVITNFNTKRYNNIINIDDNNRIYHIGTMLPRKLKKFTNISNSIDAKNSHPYLLNYFILNYFFNNSSLDVTSDLHDFYYHISVFFQSNSTSLNTFNIRKDLCKHLINNEIHLDKINAVKLIQQDVFKYMLRTSKGQLWVQLVEKSDGRFTMEQLKGEMFKKLFYNKQVRIDKDIDPLVLFFRQEYPTVYQILLSYKRELRQALAGAEKKDIKKIKHKHHLANKLMRLESQIFLGALKTIYQSNDKYRCIHIHDAIVIINHTVDVEYVKSVLYEKYKAFGLSPTFSEV